MIGAMLSACLVVSGCSEEVPEITEGNITAKVHTPSRDWIYMQPVPIMYCWPTGKTTICTTTYTYNPVPKHDPEKWIINIKDCDVSGQPKGECFSREVPVSERQYEQVEVGGHYVVPVPSNP